MATTLPALLAPWVQYVAPVPGARVILLCFHHAGGAASAYRPWAGALADRGVEVWPVQTPGREGRFREAPADDLEALAGTLHALVTPQIGDRPYAVYGHSAGAVVAYAYAKRAAELGLAGPRHFFAGACRPPRHPDPDFPLHRLGREAFARRLLGFGAVPAAMWELPEIADHMISVTRADLRLVETYRWPADLELDCPVTVFGGVEDASVPAAVLPGWSAVTAARFESVEVPGGHFPAGAARQRVWEVVRRELNGL